LSSVAVIELSAFNIDAQHLVFNLQSFPPCALTLHLEHTMSLFKKMSPRSLKAPSINSQVEEKPLPQSPSTEKEPENVRKDPFFYYVPLVILVSSLMTSFCFARNPRLQVEDTLFKTSRIDFEKHSKIFWETYLRNRNGSNPVSGFTDRKPLRLDGIDVSEFKCLVKALYHKSVSTAITTEHDC
jgi:hypothetical protein